MKKRLAVSIVMAAVLAAGGCGGTAESTAQSTAGNTAGSMSSEAVSESASSEALAETETEEAVSEVEVIAESVSSEETVPKESVPEENTAEIGNPWTDFAGYEEASEAAGMDFFIPDFPDGYTLSGYRVMSGSVFEADYEGAEGDRVCLRKGITSGNGEDLESFSGDFNTYDETDDMEVGDIRVIVKKNEIADEDICFTGTWYLYGFGPMDYIYAMTSDNGIPEDDFERMVIAVITSEVSSFGMEKAGEKMAGIYWEDLSDAMEECVGIRGTAGSSLKAAQAVEELLGFAVKYSLNESMVPYAEETARKILAAMPEAERADFGPTYSEVVAPVGDQVFADYETVRPAFADSGEDEDMQKYLAVSTAEENWKALRAALAFTSGE